MNILLTSAGRRSYLVEYFKSEIGQGQIHVSNISPVSSAFTVADKHVISPLIYDPGYIDFLLKYCKENCIDALIALLDMDLLVLAKNRKRFEDIGVRLIVSDEQVIEICNDKWNTYQFLKEKGFDAPKTYIDLNEALEALDTGVITYPVIVKPRWGMASIAVYTANNRRELKGLYKKIQEEIFETVLKYESDQNRDACVLIQQMLQGQEYGLDVINDLEGNYRTTIVKKKIAMRSGETDCAMTVKDENIAKVGEQLSKAMGHIANLDTDIFVDGEKIYILEMNARFGGGYPFSHVAGVNLPKAIIRWLQGKTVSEDCFAYRETMGMKDLRIVELKDMCKD